jgi:hypothetical protein
MGGAERTVATLCERAERCPVGGDWQCRCSVVTGRCLGLVASGLVAVRFGYAALFVVTGTIALAAAAGVRTIWGEGATNDDGRSARAGEVEA